MTMPNKSESCQMNKKTQHEFLTSLDLLTEELEPFVPLLLEELWELGSMPEYIIELIESNIPTAGIREVTDFGCGKGAVLIKLAQRFNFTGQGIDLVPEFISAAQQYAKHYGVENRLTFKKEDFVKTICSVKNQDLVIYGFDSGILGDLKQTLHQLKVCITDKGFILLECMFSTNATQSGKTVPSEQEMRQQIHDCNLVILDRIDWEKDKVKGVNSVNNSLIQKKVNELIRLYPEKAPLFDSYMENQIKECREMENTFICTTLLLQDNKCSASSSSIR